MLPRAAHIFYLAGIPSIPLVDRTKKPSIRWERYKNSLPGWRDMQLWSGANDWALITGHRGLCVIDFDDFSTFGHWQRWAARRGGIAWHVAREAYMVRTHRGVHVYCRLLNACSNMRLSNADGQQVIDILARGKLVTLAGSTHACGHVYAPLAGHERMYWPVANTLSDVLPAALLATATRAIPLNIPPRVAHDDLWPVQRSRGNESMVAGIKAKVSLANYFPHRQPHGNYDQVPCPLHDDEHPSAALWRDDRFYCFAGCTPKPFDVIDLHAALHGMSVREAIYDLWRSLC